jgi:hypothetical protein
VRRRPRRRRHRGPALPGLEAEAAGALPLLRDSLYEDETQKAQFMLGFRRICYSVVDGFHQDGSRDIRDAGRRPGQAARNPSRSPTIADDTAIS